MSLTDRLNRIAEEADRLLTPPSHGDYKDFAVAQYAAFREAEERLGLYGTLDEAGAPDANSCPRAWMDWSW